MILIMTPESEKQNADVSVERVGDITPEPVTNEWWI